MGEVTEDTVPGLALLGAGQFACTTYVPKLGDLAHLASLKIIWSRSKDAALKGLELAKPYAPEAEAKWGDEGLEAIWNDKTIHAVAVVLPAQAQLNVVLQALQAGKHVIQEKPVGPTVAEVCKAWSAYQALATQKLKLPIWAVAENYRFEPGLIQAARFVKEAGALMAVQVTMEVPMNSSNPYFLSTWRRDPDFKGGFLIDVGVHFIAGLRLIVGSEVSSVSALATHVNSSLPNPDNISSLLQFSNGCTGVLNLSLSATTRKVSWRVVGSLGTVEAVRGVEDGKHGYKCTFHPSKGSPQEGFGAFAGVQEELKSFVVDVAQSLSEEILEMLVLPCA
ncbi:hypothetical protein CY35_06G013900 [Sphagnum magellanicum]|nr:hypothetical protein CY35_06G013900 [Sphagnum magellanicum]